VDGDNLAVGGTAGEADIGYAADRPLDTTLFALRLATTRRLRWQRHVERICRLGSRDVPSSTRLS
jgi:hypothetical protein